jgi:hypothetical protein
MDTCNINLIICGSGFAIGFCISNLRNADGAGSQATSLN